MVNKMISPRRGRVSLLVLLTLVSRALTTSVASGQTSGWSQPVLLSPQLHSSWFPDVATDMAGQVHVVWSAVLNGYDTVVYTTSTNGQEWSKVNDIFALPQE